MVVLASIFFEGAEMAEEFMVGAQLDLSLLPFDGDGRQRRAQIQELEELGCGPGRWAIAEGFFYFDSNKSQWAMGLLQLMVAIDREKVV